MCTLGSFVLFTILAKQPDSDAQLSSKLSKICGSLYQESMITSSSHICVITVHQINLCACFSCLFVHKISNKMPSIKISQNVHDARFVVFCLISN